MKPIVARVVGASKTYPAADAPVVALKPTTLDFYGGDLTLILGPSGSGKTTLLSLLGCVIYPTTGLVKVGDTDTTKLNEKQLARLRLQQIGFVFQSFNLLAPLTAADNVMFPLKLLGVGAAEARQRAEDGLRKLGMYDKRKAMPKQMSGGQQQRVAIARAMVTNAPLMLCDEPTASLDSKSADTVMEELKEISQSGRAVIVVTHDLRLEKYANRIIYVTNGEASETKPDESQLH